MAMIRASLIVGSCENDVTLRTMASVGSEAIHNISRLGLGIPIATTMIWAPFSRARTASGIVLS